MTTRALSSKMAAIYSLGFLQDEDIKGGNNSTYLMPKEYFSPVAGSYLPSGN